MTPPTDTLTLRYTEELCIQDLRRRTHFSLYRWFSNGYKWWRGKGKGYYRRSIGVHSLVVATLRPSRLPFTPRPCARLTACLAPPRCATQRRLVPLTQSSPSTEENVASKRKQGRAAETMAFGVMACPLPLLCTPTERKTGNTKSYIHRNLNCVSKNQRGKENDAYLSYFF